MDPNATLREISLDLADGDLDQAYDRCHDLHYWLRHGGFAPDWGQFPAATRYYHLVIGRMV